MLSISIEKEIAYQESYPIVCHSGYLSSFSTTYGYICGFFEGQLCCFIPFVVKRKLIFQYVEMKCETVKLDKSIDEKQFLDQVVAYFKKYTDYDFISQPPTNTLFLQTPAHSIKAPFGSYRVDLTCDEEVLWKNIHGKHKNVIRKAGKDGIEVFMNAQYFDMVYQNIVETLARNKMSMLPESQLRNMLQNMPDAVMVACSMKDDVVQSSAIILYSKERAYYFWGGTSEDISAGANNLMHWEIMKALKQKGVQTYDFVGARLDTSNNVRLEGIQRFKSRFGATLYKGYLWKYPLKKWKYHLFYLMVKLKQKKGDIIDQEKNTLDI